MIEILLSVLDVPLIAVGYSVLYQMTTILQEILWKAISSPDNEFSPNGKTLRERTSTQ